MFFTSIILANLFFFIESWSTHDSRIRTRIIGGRDALAGEFPYHALVRFFLNHNEIKGFESCGGTIIDPSWILTAAHCLTHPEKDNTVDTSVTVIAGRYKKRGDEDNEQLQRTKEFYVHRGYDRGSRAISKWDIALIKLEEPLRLNDRVKTAFLPAFGSVPTGNVTIVGWGVIAERYPAVPKATPNVLQVGQYYIADCEPLLDVLRKKNPKSKYAIHETKICIGPTTKGHGTCSGDSGGGLISLNDEGKPVVVGLVSSRFGRCGEKDTLTSPTDVAKFVKWIHNITGLSYE